MSLMFYLYLLTSCGFAFIGILALAYNASSSLNRQFFLLNVNLSLWALMLSFMNMTADAGTAIVFRNYSTIFWSLAYVLILHFFLILARKDRIVRNPLLMGLLYLPGLFSVALYYFAVPQTAEHLFMGPVGWYYADSASYGFLYDQYFNIYYAVYALGSLALTVIWGRRSPFRRDKFQSRVIALSFTGAFLLGSLTDVLLPLLGFYDVPQLAITIMLITTSSVWYAISRHRFMVLSPALLAADILKTIQEGMIIVNQFGAIESVNNFAAGKLACNERAITGKPLAVLLPELALADLQKMTSTREMIMRSTTGQEFPALLTCSTLTDSWGEPFGSLIVFQDVSVIKHIQSELEKTNLETEHKIRERTKYLHDANDELKNEIAARIEMESQVSKLAYLDPLTGLANRRLFRDKLSEKIKDSSRNRVPFCVIFLDLDAFKIVNDTLGHIHGDELLKLVASRLSGRMRLLDTIGRVGGDEFLIMVHNTPDTEACESVGNKLIDAFRDPFQLQDHSIYVTASIGIARYPADGEDADTLIKNADLAMYKAKDKGKNKFEICDSDMKNSISGLMQLQSDLYQVIERRQLELYYQPQVDARNGRIDGLEALLRWNHPTRGIVSPSEFIPLAEKTGLIIPIGEWVLHEACRQNKAWQEQGLACIPVAVNLSIKQLIDSSIIDKVIRALENTGLDPSWLEIEITESVLMQDPELVTSTLDRLKELGIRISIDDFGTEYSSLHYLKQLPVDRIKIAMTFIHGIAINRKDEAIISAMIALADNLGIEIIAEGVETTAQVEYLKKANCTDIQGFYFYRPMPAGPVEQLLTEGFSVSGEPARADDDILAVT